MGREVCTSETSGKKKKLGQFLSRERLILILSCRWKDRNTWGKLEVKIGFYRKVRPFGGKDTKRQTRTFKNMSVGYECTGNSAGGVLASASILATTIEGVSETYTQDAGRAGQGRA